MEQQKFTHFSRFWMQLRFSFWLALSGFVSFSLCPLTWWQGRGRSLTLSSSSFVFMLLKILKYSLLTCFRCTQNNSVIYVYTHMCLSGLKIHLQCKRCRFDPWVRKIPWRRAWQPTPVFMSGESHGQRSLTCFSPQGGQESDTAEAPEHAHMHTYTCWLLFRFFSVIGYYKILN